MKTGQETTEKLLNIKRALLIKNYYKKIRKKI